MIREVALIALPLLAIAPARAKEAETDEVKDGFSIDGSFRARLEGIDGQFRPGGVDTAALLFQTDLDATYRTGPVWLGIEVQDSRVYFEHDDSSVSTNEVNALEPIQAYVASDLGKGASLKAGRFTMELGSKRFVTRNIFRNTTNAFTGAQFNWRPAEKDKLTLFWTMPQSIKPDDHPSLLDNDVALDKERSAEQLFGGFASIGHVLGGNLEGYAFRLAERDAPDFLTRNRRLWTLGGRFYADPKPGHPDWEVEAAYQTGTARATTAATDLTSLKVRAGFVHAALGYTFDRAWKPRLAITYDYATGEGRGPHYTRFDTLFGDTVFEYGPSSFYGALNRNNISSPTLRAEVTPDKRWDAYLTVRGLWLASATDSFAVTNVIDRTGRSGKFAGVQYDLRVRYWVVPKTLQLSAGAVLLDKGRFLRDAPNAPRNGDTHFGFLEATYSF